MGNLANTNLARFSRTVPAQKLDLYAYPELSSKTTHQQRDLNNGVVVREYSVVFWVTVVPRVKLPKRDGISGAHISALGFRRFAVGGRPIILWSKDFIEGPKAGGSTRSTRYAEHYKWQGWQGGLWILARLAD